jgi:hypothetical protein
MTVRIGYRGDWGPTWLRRCVIKLEFAWEHIGWGFYKDRRFPMIRIFPVPFMKITLGLINGPSVDKRREP